jgi:hypothetical protein
MTNEDKYNILIKKGFKYDELSDKVIGSKGKPITRLYCGNIRINFKHDNKFYNFYEIQFKRFWNSKK